MHTMELPADMALTQVWLAMEVRRPQAPFHRECLQEALHPGRVWGLDFLWMADPRPQLHQGFPVHTFGMPGWIL